MKTVEPYPHSLTQIFAQIDVFPPGPDSSLMLYTPGTVLTNSKHPYDYDTVCLTNRHLNPDLSQEWVIGFLTANDAVPTIEASIREHMDGFAIKGFCYSFGILIADIWEDTTYSQGMPNPTPLSHEAVMHDSQPVLNAFSTSTNKTLFSNS